MRNNCHQVAHYCRCANDEYRPTGVAMGACSTSSRQGLCAALNNGPERCWHATMLQFMFIAWTSGHAYAEHMCAHRMRMNGLLVGLLETQCCISSCAGAPHVCLSVLHMEGEDAACTQHCTTAAPKSWAQVRQPMGQESLHAPLASTRPCCCHAVAYHAVTDAACTPAGGRTYW